MQVLQITDPHLYGNSSGHLRGVETDSSLRNVLDAALDAGIDYAAVLVTGDIVQDDVAGYLRFKSILSAMGKPILCLPGNHDEPDAMRVSLAAEPFRYCGAHLIGGWNFIMLDSYHSGHVGGRLGTAELERLDAALGACPAHAMVCLHHHPVPMRSLWLDSVGLADSDDFWRVVDAHPHVRGVAWGHVHQSYDAVRNGVRLYATPSTCAQFLPHSDRYALDARPPAYRRLELHADGRIDSEVHWVDFLALRRAATR